MFDFRKQIDYWTRGADNDIETAELLISGRKYLEGLFFCHLTIEMVNEYFQKTKMLLECLKSML